MAAVRKVFPDAGYVTKTGLKDTVYHKSTSKQLFPLLSITSGHQNSALLDFMN